MITLDAVARENARSGPQMTASICRGDVVSYAALQERVTRLAHVLAARGVSRGDRIVWCAHNCHRWTEALLASANVGAVLCTLNWRLRIDEVAAQLVELEPSVILHDETGEAAAGLGEIAPAAVLIAIDGQEADGYEALLADSVEIARAPAGAVDDPLLLLYVPTPDGGNAGSMLTHANLMATATLMTQAQSIDSSTVNLASAPLFHIAGLFTLLPTLVMRGTNVYIERPQAREMCAAIHEHRCTRGFVLAPTVQEMVALNADGRYDLGSFQSSLPVPAWRAMVAEDLSPWGRRTGGFGQTETGMVVLAAYGEDGASSTSGRAVPGTEVSIVDPDGAELPADAVGEIVVRGASVHAGYWKRPELNAVRFRGGWWHTNDLGTRRADGSLVFVAPMGRLLKSGAENIYASEVEQCLRDHPAIAEAAVIGVPDPVWVQSVKAIVVPHPDAVAPSAEEIVEHCRQRIASYKKPRFVEVRVQPLPRDHGAIDYPALDREYGGGGYPGHGTRSI